MEIANSCFGEAITQEQQRLATLQRRAVNTPGALEGTLAETFQELQITLEELQVADEEIQRQNEELAAARQAAEGERQRYQELFDFAPDAYIVTDVAATIQQANHAAASLLAVPTLRLRRKPLCLYVEPEEQQAFYGHLTNLCNREGVYSWEIRLRPRGRDPLPAAITTAVVRDTQGHALGLRWLLRDISEQKAMQERTKQAEQAIQQSREQLRALATRLQNQQEEERRRIAREIHDELAQSLTALKIDVAWLSKRLRGADAGCRARLGDMTALLNGLVSSVRRIGTELRPGILDDLGLTAAIEWQLQEMQKRTGMAYSLTLPEEEILLDQARATAMFRIFQEALTNVLRHASARKVAVHLSRQPTGLILAITDDGKGITPSQLTDRRSLGLLSMRERAQLLGGKVSIQATAGEGTTVTLRMPYETTPNRGG
jgi:PAS domain S-box-containing protein